MAVALEETVVRSFVSDHEGLPVIAIFRKEVTISSKPNAGLCRTDRIHSQLSGSTTSPRLDRDPLTRGSFLLCVALRVQGLF